MTTRKRQPRTSGEAPEQVTQPKAEPKVEDSGKTTTVTVLSSSVTYRTQTGGRGIAREGDTITVPAGVAERLIAANAAK